MKASHKLLIYTIIVVIILATAGILVLRKALQHTLQENSLKLPYRTVAVNDFQNVDFSAHWRVQIRQGKEYQVELAVPDSAGWKPRLENKNGTLYFYADSIPVAYPPKHLYARITVPTLQQIRAIEGTRIRMSSCKMDTLQIRLENGGSFLSHDNQFDKLSVQTAGYANVQFSTGMLPPPE